MNSIYLFLGFALSAQPAFAKAALKVILINTSEIRTVLDNHHVDHSWLENGSLQNLTYEYEQNLFKGVLSDLNDESRLCKDMGGHCIVNAYLDPPKLLIGPDVMSAPMHRGWGIGNQLSLFGFLKAIDLIPFRYLPYFFECRFF
jgi:hypothetical protein